MIFVMKCRLLYVLSLLKAFYCGNGLHFLGAAALRVQEKGWRNIYEIQRVTSPKLFANSQLKSAMNKLQYEYIKPVQRTFDRLKLQMRNRFNINKFSFKNPSAPRFGKIRINWTYVLIGSNIVAFGMTSKWPHLLRKYLKSNLMISRGQTYRLVSSIFLHASTSHLAMNCFSLYNIGPQAQRLFGSERFIITYLLSGTLANLYTFAVNASPFAVGASGSIYGIIGAMAMFYYRNKEILGNSAKSGNLTCCLTMKFKN